MRKLVMHRENYPDDVTRIVEAMRAAGYCIDRRTAMEAWSEYSDSVCASWLHLPVDDNSVVDVICDYVEVIE